MTPSLILDFVSRVPDSLRDAVETLLERSTHGREDLLSELDSYTRRIDAAARRRHDLDVDLAEGILQACRRLVEVDWDELDEDRRRLVGVACSYYLDAEDEDGDLESVFGFDDDALILNAALDAIGRPELKVRI